MKKNSRLAGYVLTGALSLGALGAAGIPAFAATPTSGNTAAAAFQQGEKGKASLSTETKQKAQEIMDQLKTKLSALGITLPEREGGRGDLFANLDDATKEKAQAIMEKEKAGTITREEAKTQLKALGVTLPEGKGHDRGDLFANLDDATKEKAQAIMEKEKAGTITREEAKTQLKALGVTLPEGKGHDRGDLFANLDDATKEKAQAIMEKEKAGTITREEAKTQLKALGVTLPEGKGHGRGDLFAGVGDATKEKAQALLDEAETELKDLGVDHLPFGKFN